MIRLAPVAALASAATFVASLLLACGGDNASEADGDAGTDGGTTFTPPVGFDEGCSRDDECTATRGSPCVECPACFPDVAVSKAKLGAYEAKRREVTCAPRDPLLTCPGAPCSVDDAVVAVCTSNKCILRKASSVDAGTDADSGG